MSAVPLKVEKIDQAYPLIQTRFPALSLEDWRQYAGRLIDGGRPAWGVMTAQYGGYIRGLFCHWPHSNLQHGDTLIVDNFTVMDLFDAKGAACALIEAMEAIAEHCRCRAIHTLMPDYPPIPIHGHLEEHGHKVSTVVLLKELQV